METLDLHERLCAMALKRFPINAQAISSQTPVQSLGDSLDFVDFLSDVEAAFKVDLVNEDIAQIQTVGDLVNLVARAIQGQAAKVT